MNKLDLLRAELAGELTNKDLAEVMEGYQHHKAWEAGKYTAVFTELSIGYTEKTGKKYIKLVSTLNNDRQRTEVMSKIGLAILEKQIMMNMGLKDMDAKGGKLIESLIKLQMEVDVWLSPTTYNDKTTLKMFGQEQLTPQVTTQPTTKRRI